MKKITLIIPFRNEGDQVYKTCKSFSTYCDESMYDIICINDKSDDGYDYTELLQFRNLKLLKNEIRLGVAGSRDKGVMNASGEYIFILDGHMRVFDDVITQILNIVPKYPNSLFCCQSDIIRKELSTGKFKLNRQPNSRGCTLESNIKGDFLNYYWDYIRPEDNYKSILPIQCVMGAAYIIKRDYYIKLHGLNGLQQYGLDEQFLSAKVYMSGGGVYLLKDIHVAHIYRQGMPLPYGFTDGIKQLNILILLYLLCPELYLEYLSSVNNSDFLEVIKQIREGLNKERDYLKLILTKKTFNNYINGKF